MQIDNEFVKGFQELDKAIETLPDGITTDVNVDGYVISVYSPYIINNEQQARFLESVPTLCRHFTLEFQHQVMEPQSKIVQEYIRIAESNADECLDSSDPATGNESNDLDLLKDTDDAASSESVKIPILSSGARDSSDESTSTSANTDRASKQVALVQQEWINFGIIASIFHVTEIKPIPSTRFVVIMSDLTWTTERKTQVSEHLPRTCMASILVWGYRSFSMQPPPKPRSCITRRRCFWIMLLMTVVAVAIVVLFSLRS